MLLVLVGLSVSCTSARRTFKNYYGALITKNYPLAASYLSNSCKSKLPRLRPNADVNQLVQIGFYQGVKSYQIIQVQPTGDSLLLAMRVTTTDGQVHIFDKVVSETVSGGNLENGKKQVDDIRYRLYKVNGQWMIDTPYCHITN